MADVSIPEVWKPIIGSADYEVSSLGRVRAVTALIWNARPGVTVIRKPAGRLLSLKPGPRGYIRVTVPWLGHGPRNSRSLNVHRLVAQAFIANPHNKPTVNHRNLDKADNRVENLEWCSHQENSQHAYAAGRFSAPPPPFGITHRMAKLTDNDIRRIRQFCKDGIPRIEIARQFKIDRSIISLIVRGLAWKHVT